MSASNRTTLERNEGEGYLASVSDLLVGLLFVFIILLMAVALDFQQAEDVARREQVRLGSERDVLQNERDFLQNERDALRYQRDTLEAERDSLVRERDRLRLAATSLEGRGDERAAFLRELEDRLEATGIPLSIDADGGVLRLPESVLFGSAEAVLSEEGQAAIGAIARVLSETLPCLSGGGADRACPPGSEPILETVLVEGHTDSRPFTGDTFRDNWDLGAQRAINTFRLLIESAPGLSDLNNARGDALIGVSSYADRRPVSRDEDEEGLRRNRRIDLRFVLAAPAGPSLGALRDSLTGAGAAPAAGSGGGGDAPAADDGPTGDEQPAGDEGRGQ